jgi:hypothetical protein
MQRYFSATCCASCECQAISLRYLLRSPKYRSTVGVPGLRYLFRCPKYHAAVGVPDLRYLFRSPKYRSTVGVPDLRYLFRSLKYVAQAAPGSHGPSGTSSRTAAAPAGALPYHAGHG